MINKRGLIILLIALVLTSCRHTMNIENAKTLYKQHDYTSSIKILKNIVKKSPRDFEALDHLGLCYRQIGDYNKAYVFLDSSIACGNSSYEVFLNAGDLAFKLDKRMEAFNSLMIAYRKDSVGLDVNYNLGLLYWQKFDAPNKALEHFYREVSAYPKHADAFGAIGQVYLNIDSTDSAFHYINKAISLDSSNYIFYYRRGLMWCSIENWDKAIEDFTKSYMLNPKSTEAIYYRGVAFINVNNLKGACNDFSHVRDPEYVREVDSLMKIYCK